MSDVRISWTPVVLKSVEEMEAESEGGIDNRLEKSRRSASFGTISAICKTFLTAFTAFTAEEATKKRKNRISTHDGTMPEKMPRKKMRNDLGEDTAFFARFNDK